MLCTTVQSWNLVLTDIVSVQQQIVIINPLVWHFSHACMHCHPAPPTTQKPHLITCNSNPFIMMQTPMDIAVCTCRYLMKEKKVTDEKTQFLYRLGPRANEILDKKQFLKTTAEVR